LLLRIQELEEKLLETQLQLERVTDEKLTRMLSIHMSPTDKTGLGYVAPSSDAASTSKTVFVKGKDKVNDDVPGTQKPYSIRRPPICHHCGLSGHVRPQCSLLKAQKARKEVPRQAKYGTRPGAQFQTPWYQAPYYQAPWSHAPRYQASQYQRPQQRFVPANHSGNSKKKIQAIYEASEGERRAVPQ
jgi:hypothetical protein